MIVKFLRNQVKQMPYKLFLLRFVFIRSRAQSTLHFVDSLDDLYTKHIIYIILFNLMLYSKKMANKFHTNNVFADELHEILNAC
jgi:hypothetical protein